MNDPVKLPFYARAALTLLMLCLIVLVLEAGNSIIMPLILAFLFAILLRPVVLFLTTKIRLPHVIAALLSVILFVIFIGAIIFFISRQAGEFATDFPRIKQNLLVHYGHLQDWIQEKFHISNTNQQNYLEQVADENTNMFVENTLTTFSSTLLRTVLVPIYTFLILLYHDLFKRFLSSLVPERNHNTLVDIMLEIKVVVQSYIVGLLIEMALIATLISTGLSIIGVPYAILLGVMAGILNLIPYIGITVATLLAIISASINSTEFSIILGVIIVNGIVHLIDNNFIVPKIVASKVRINALAAIVGVFTGGLMAGLTGMFLAIPMVAILKVIFERVEDLKSWSILMGDNLSKTIKWRKIKLSSPNENASEKEEKEKPSNESSEKKD
jgi:predicted PurR-regulated permease PerM